MDTYDVIVIGGGPAGLSAAILLGRARRSVLVIDSGEPRNKRAARVNGFLAVPGASPATLRARGEQQARSFGAHFIDGVVVDASPSAPLTDTDRTAFEVHLADGSELTARKLLFATGMRDELPRIPGFHECYGQTIHHCPYCDGWEHRDRRLVAFGESSQSAIALAELLLAWSNRVTVATNGTYLGEDDKVRLQDVGIQLREAGVMSIEHEAGELQALLLTSAERLEADALFFSAGSVACCSIPMQLGCESNEKGRIRTTDRQGTGLPGIFLAGDADGDVQFAIVAAAEGAVAATAIHKELHQEDLRPGLKPQ